MPVNESNRRLYELAAKRYQRQLWELADSPGMTPDRPEYQEAQRRLNEVGAQLDEYNKASRKTDKNGRLTADANTWIAPKVDPPKAKEPEDYSFHFEPSVAEVRNFIRNDPETARRIGVTEDYITGIKTPEAREQVLDPTSGAPAGFNVRPAVTWLDEMTETEPPYAAVANHLWEQRMEQAKQRGEGVKRYRDVRFEPGQRIDYLSGGLEYNIDRRLAPLALGVADSFSAGQATQGLNAAHDLLDYSLSRPQTQTQDFQQDVADPMTGQPVGQNTVTPQAPTLQPDAIPSGDEVAARSPAFHLAGNLAGYALPLNPANAAQEMLHAGVMSAAERFAPRIPEMITRPIASAAAGAVVNTGEAAINDFSSALNQGASLGQAAQVVGENAPLQAAVGGVGGGVFDMAGQGLSLARQGLGSVEDRRALQNLRAGGGDTSVLGGVTAPPEVSGYIRQSLEPRVGPDGSIEPPLGSAAALASDAVVPHVRESIRARAAEEAKAIEAENQAYFNHPAYRGIEHTTAPIVDEILNMADEGATRGPVTGEPGNIDPERLNKVTRELRVLAEPQFVPVERAQEFADAHGYRVMDAQQAQRLWGRAEPPPAGSVAVIVPKKLNADLLTQFEQRIDRQFKENEGYKDPIYTRINNAAKTVRDQFPYFEDELGNLVPPPAAEGEFVDPSGPDTPSTLDGPETPPTETDPGPSLPPGGGGAPPQLPSGGPEAPRAAEPEAPFTMRSVAPEEATPLSLLAGNKLAMPETAAPSSRTRENDRVWKGMDPEQMRQEGVAVPRKFLAGHLEAQGIKPDKTPEEVARMSAESDARWREQFGDLTWEEVYGDGGIADRRVRAAREGRPPSVDRRGRPINNDGNTEPLMRAPERPDDPPAQAPTLATAIRSSAGNSGLADVPSIVRALGGDTKAAHQLLLDAYEAGAIELRPEGGLNRFSPEDRALMLKGPQGTELSQVRVIDPDLLDELSGKADLDQSLPAPSPKEWTAAVDEGEQWYDDIVQPGAPARSSEAKRLNDLTQQQSALEEARAQVADINERLGPISEGSQMQMLLDVLSQKLGRTVTKEDLVKAGLLAGGVAAAASSDNEEDDAAVAVGGVLAGGQRALRRTGRDAHYVLSNLTYGGSEALRQFVRDISFIRDIPRLSNGTISDIIEAARQAGLKPLETEMVVARLEDMIPGRGDIAPRRNRTDVSYGDVQRATAEAAGEVALDDIGTYVGQGVDNETGLPVVDSPRSRQARTYATGASKPLEAAGHEVQRGVDYSLENVLGRGKDATDLAKAWSLDELKAIGGNKVESVISPYGQNGVVWRAYGTDGHRGGAAAWRIERTIRKEGNQIIVDHNYFKLREDLRDSGEGAKVIKKQFEEYKKMGVNRVNIDSTAWVGRYYWPSLGFDNPEAVPEALDAYRDFLQKKHGLSEEEARNATKGIRSLPSLANAEHGKEFFLNDDYDGAWNRNLTMKIDESNPRYQLLKKRLDIMVATGVGLGALMSDDEDTEEGGLAAAAVIGGAGGGSERPKGPRQPRAKLDDGREVQGFSAKRRQQHERLSAVEKNKTLTSADHERALRNKVIGFNQGDDIDVDRALEDEARRAGKLKELRTAAATSVYPGLRRRAMPGSGRGFVNNLVDMGRFRLDKVLEVLGGEPRNPFARDPNGITADAARRFFNVTGGRPGARYGNDALKIYNELFPSKREEEEEQ